MKKTKRGQRPGTFHIDKRADQIVGSGLLNPDDPDENWTTLQLAVRLGVSVQWLEIQRGKDGGPPFVMLAGRVIRYRPADVRAWLETRSHKSTAEYMSNNNKKKASAR